MDTYEFNSIGSALGREGKFDEAILYFDRAIKLDKSNVKAWYNKALTLKNLRRYAESLKCLKYAQKLSPNDSEIMRKIEEIRVILKAQKTPPHTSAGFTQSLFKSEKPFPYFIIAVVAVAAIIGILKPRTSFYDGRINQSDSVPIHNGVPPQSIVKIPQSPPNVEQEHTPYRLPNGTVVKKRTGRKGLGTLMIENGTVKDAIVKMVSNSEPDKAYCAIYIQANSQVKIAGVNRGTYELWFSLGQDWDRKKQIFLADKSYAKFENRLDFGETRSEDYLGNANIVYSTWRMTLHPVVSGNARQSSTTEQEFCSLE